MWVSDWEFGGSSLGVERASFAVGAMRYVDPGSLTLEQAKIVALKMLRNTIETGVEGIGGRVQMGVVREHCGQAISNLKRERGPNRSLDVWNYTSTSEGALSRTKPARAAARAEPLLLCHLRG